MNYGGNIGILDNQKVKITPSTSFLDIIEDPQLLTQNYLRTETVDPRKFRLPYDNPSKIVCIGKNYQAHAEELGSSVPSEPLVFLKPASALIGPYEHIIYPK